MTHFHQPTNLDYQDPIRVGLVGCGRLAEVGYLPAFRQSAAIKLAAVADLNQPRCRAIAPGVPAHETIDALLKAGGIDALVISTPTRFHLPNARSAAAAGLPALVEKPPALTLDEARALDHLKPRPWIGFNRRFDPDITRLKDRLPREGSIYLEFGSRLSSWNPFDMQDDALLDLAPHLIDLARWLTGSEISSARALALNDHCVKFELKLEWGYATISCSNQSYYHERILVKDGQGQERGSYNRGGLVSGIAARLQPQRKNPLVGLMIRQLEAFGLSVRGLLNQAPLATSTDGLAVMSVIDAVRRSATQGGAECALQTIGLSD
jgi:predicted dehydrogenase